MKLLICMPFGKRDNLFKINKVIHNCVKVLKQYVKQIWKGDGL
jgi:hypothetical protein